MVVICISGTPATGKTSVAKALAKKLGWKLIELNELAEKKQLYCGYDRKRNVNIVDVEALKKEVGKIRGSDVILESHYAHDMPCDYVVILRTNPGELRARMRAKQWPSRKIEENVEAEIMEVCKGEALGRGKIIEIDTTEKKPTAVADEIVRHLRNDFKYRTKRKT
jgi:adenylate kinase